jgi:hypothetical protein
MPWMQEKTEDRGRDGERNNSLVLTGSVWMTVVKVHHIDTLTRTFIFAGFL